MERWFLLRSLQGRHLSAIVARPMTPPPYTPEGSTRDKVYRFVREQLEAGRSPTLREVQQAMGFRAVETARQHLVRLVEEKRLRKDPGARGYALPARDAVQSISVPLLGRVPAGGLEEAIEDYAWSLPVDVSSSMQRDALFALRVEGESMRDAGILPGDLVVVQMQPTARSGEIVVAMVDDEATIKTLRRVGRRVELHPENPEYQPIVPRPEQEFRILGRVIEVRRHLLGHPGGAAASSSQRRRRQS